MPAAEQAAFHLPSSWPTSDLVWAVQGPCDQLKPPAKQDQPCWQLGPQPAITIAKETGHPGLFGKCGLWWIHSATLGKRNVAIPKLKTFAYFTFMFRMTSLNFTCSCLHFFAVSRTTWGRTMENHSEIVNPHFALAKDHCMVCRKSWNRKVRL